MQRNRAQHNAYAFCGSAWLSITEGDLRGWVGAWSGSWVGHFFKLHGSSRALAHRSLLASLQGDHEVFVSMYKLQEENVPQARAIPARG
jgi:hypothetical protein